MCGSGSFLVEAAQTALRIAPGETRWFGFERLKNFDAEAWERMRDEAASKPGAEDLAAVALIHGSDVSGDAIAITRGNLERAGIEPEVALAIAPKQVDARQVRPQAESGIVIANPPYGERLAIRGERAVSRGLQPDDDELTAFFAEFGDTLKQRFAGWTCHILTSDMALQKKLRLSPDRRVVLFNGAIECRLYRFAVVAGQHR